MKNIVMISLLILSLFSNPLRADDLFLSEALDSQDAHTISFQEVPVIEFIRFVSRISHVNFIFDDKELGFNISLSSGKPVSSTQVLQALIQILKVHGFRVLKEEGYLVIHKMISKEMAALDQRSAADIARRPEAAKEQGISLPEKREGVAPDIDPEFLVYKLQYHSGAEIEEAIKKIAGDLKTKPQTSAKYIQAIQSIQWLKATNSLVCSGDKEVLGSVKKLIESLDVALRQVFIEVLVVETDSRKSSEFGLEWAAGGKVKDSIGFGTGSFRDTGNKSFASAFKGINAQNKPTGPGQIPMGRGFDMGIVGDIIFHRGRSFLSLGALVTALQQDKDTTIVLNQKIITQDNKNSTIFVGDNIPFAGSLVETIGSGQQTTSNIEYRDVGVTLSITPRLGEGDVITLEIKEEITEAVENDLNMLAGRVNGIQTTKTNMMTNAHVPDKHFLVLSGMIRNSKRNQKTGVPCLGGLPLIGALFSKDVKRSEKRNVIVFVRPHIINSMDDYQNLTHDQEGFNELPASPSSLGKN